MKHRSLTLLFVALFTLALVAPAPAHATTTYNDSLSRFTFQIPDGYTPSSDSDTVGLFLNSPSGDTQLFFLALSYDPQFPVVLNDVTKDIKEFFLTDTTNAKPGPRDGQLVNFGGQPSIVIDQTYTDETGAQHLLMVVTVEGQNFYQAGFAVPEKQFDATYKQVAPAINSFKFLPAASVFVPDATPTPDAIVRRLGNG